MLPLVAFTLVFSHVKKPKLNEEESWAKRALSEMTLEEKIGQFFMVAAFSNGSEEHLEEIESYVKNQRIGGVIFFQGERADLKQAIHRFQSQAKVPLFIGMDAEWGVKMRLYGEDRLPYAYTMGAANSVQLTRQYGALLAQECQELGIHMCFAPVADVNNNPKNPVIGFRAFGASAEKVGDMVSAMTHGLEDNGVMACLKHFPGHGNTDKDSHLELPMVNSSLHELETNELKPFVKGIKAGASSVMIGHLSVPSLDPSGISASLSRKIIQDKLQKEMQFEGLVISDALNMKAVSEKYGKSEVVLKAFLAGCDILLYPESVQEAIELIAKKVKNKEISEDTIDARCLKILKLKHRFVVSKPKFIKHTTEEKQAFQFHAYEKAITVLKSKYKQPFLADLNDQTVVISIGKNKSPFYHHLKKYMDFQYFHFYSIEEAKEHLSKKSHGHQKMILTMHPLTVRNKNHFGLGEDFQSLVDLFPHHTSNALVLFGNPLGIGAYDLKHFDHILVGYENHDVMQQAMVHALVGATEIYGKLPMNINPQWTEHAGLYIPDLGRVKYTLPEYVGISSEKLKSIDLIVQNAMQKGAFPGCQIAITVRGSMIWDKSYGFHTYDQKEPVLHDDLYDIASVSKIVGSTYALMHLQTDGKIDLDQNLNHYLPELVRHTPFRNITLREMMAHQAGLTAWIPFYLKTLEKGELNPSIYSKTRKKGFEVQVAEDLFISKAYEDSIYAQILKSDLGAKKYLYSDLGYYFIKKIVEKKSRMDLDAYLMKHIYRPIGLKHIGYQPLNRFGLHQIIPTENDQQFRKQQIHGFVHDPGAAMLGGVGGHAGVFSNANDLAVLMQVLLNQGEYGDQCYFAPEVIEEYTRAQFPGNRRGVGFDRPNASGGGTCHELASNKSFGHSGFTGTLIWSDPTYALNYVFLSNRVYQNAENWKLRDMNIRTEIQRVIYESMMIIKK